MQLKEIYSNITNTKFLATPYTQTAIEEGNELYRTKRYMFDHFAKITQFCKDAGYQFPNNNNAILLAAGICIFDITSRKGTKITVKLLDHMIIELVVENITIGKFAPSICQIAEIIADAVARF